MKKEEIHLGDWHRILIGNAPLEFMLEVVLRTLIIYVIMFITMRLLGKRMNAQLTVVELTVMILLGAILAVAMQLPERGLLQSVVVLGCVLAMYRGINLLSFKYKGVEHFTQGSLKLMVADGVLDLAAMADARLSREQLFAKLRTASYQQLGQVKRVYLEANGEFSVYQQKPARPGLSILPDKDRAIHEQEPKQESCVACERCGHTEPASRPPRTCPRCGCEKWTYTVNKID